MDLFENSSPVKLELPPDAPLAVRFVPGTLDEFYGQEHLLGPGKLLRRAIEADRLSSAIFFGPPGTGKSALARFIAARTKAAFIEMNAVTCGVADIRRAIEQARERRWSKGQKTMLQLDEIHHFNKTQQDALLPQVEKGEITLLGITTENPFFYVNAALLSRSQVFEFKTLGEEAIAKIVRRAVETGMLGKTRVTVDADAMAHWSRAAAGDARRALTALEVAAQTTSAGADGTIRIGLTAAKQCIQANMLAHDKSGDAHYDCLSAFIKSIRGCDPDAALYWMARLLEGGEDPRLIARRMAISASEDVGNADPQALSVAMAAFLAVERVGMPEARIPLAQACTYLACAPKSNASYEALGRAQEEVKSGRTQEVPIHLKDTTSDGDALGHGRGYKYPHSYPGHFVQQQYMKEPRRFYEPSDQGFEAQIAKRLAGWRKP